VRNDNISRMCIQIL